MGLSAANLNVLLSLYKDEFFVNSQSVIELGSQNLQDDGNTSFIINHINGDNNLKSNEIKSARDFYNALGFSDYQCIDPDLRHKAHNIDLNEIIDEPSLKNAFDLVTNFGTSEHCFNQNNCFLNIHNFCKVGGLMVHGLPFQGALNEGLINYQPNFFFCLASANNYEIIGTYINLNGFAGDLIPYSDQLMKVLKLPDSSIPTTSIIVVLKKIEHENFRTPWNSKYLGTCKFEKYQFQKETEYFLPVPVKELSTWNHFEHIMKRVKSVGILNSIKRFFFFRNK